MVASRSRKCTLQPWITLVLRQVHGVREQENGIAWVGWKAELEARTSIQRAIALVQRRHTPDEATTFTSQSTKYQARTSPLKAIHRDLIEDPGAVINLINDHKIIRDVHKLDFQDQSLVWAWTKGKHRDRSKQMCGLSGNTRDYWRPSIDSLHKLCFARAHVSANRTAVQLCSMNQTFLYLLLLLNLLYNTVYTVQYSCTTVQL